MTAKCPVFTVDILNGTVNGLKPNRATSEIKTEFPCATSSEDEGSTRGSLFSKLGTPKMKDTHWDAYETQYGTLVLHYDAAGKVNLIQGFFILLPAS